ncbi:UNVERIFIED_CONTAM: hypothetical protein FKN15_044492 [Acipenser sinensis]
MKVACVTRPVSLLEILWPEPKKEEPPATEKGGGQETAAIATITAGVWHTIATASTNTMSRVPSASATAEESHTEGSIAAASATATPGECHPAVCLSTDSIDLAGGARLATVIISTANIPPARIAPALVASLFAVSMAAASVVIEGGPHTVAATHVVDLNLLKEEVMLYSCTPRNFSVSLREELKRTDTIFWPNCLLVKRCGGNCACCVHSCHDCQCVPTKVTKKYHEICLRIAASPTVLMID